MIIPAFGLGVIADDVAVTRDFYATYFWIRGADRPGWFVTMGHAESDYELSIVAHDHDSVPPAYNRTASGVLSPVVSDATSTYEKLAAAGTPVLRKLVDDPWGQRHFFVTNPSGFLIDCIQIIPPDPAWMAANSLAAQVVG